MYKRLNVSRKSSKRPSGSLPSLRLSEERNQMALIILSGALANKPFNGGNAWSRLNWILGLKKLGFGVCFIEQISRANCINAAGAPSDFEDSVNLAYFRAVMDRFNLSR